MKTMLRFFTVIVFLAYLSVCTASHAAELSDFVGVWSGNWRSELGNSGSFSLELVTDTNTGQLKSSMKEIGGRSSNQFPWKGVATLKGDELEIVSENGRVDRLRFETDGTLKGDFDWGKSWVPNGTLKLRKEEKR